MARHTLASSFKGASNEYKAAAYYLSEGLNVFWPSMQQGIVDFVLESPRGYESVQVKTAQFYTNRGHDYIRLTSLKDIWKYDRLFVIYEHIMWDIPVLDMLDQYENSTTMWLYSFNQDGSKFDRYLVEGHPTDLLVIH